MPQPLRFLRSRAAQCLTLMLLVQASLIGVLAPAEDVPLSRPLTLIPKQLSGWRMYGEEGVIEPEIMNLLKADDTLSRTYVDPGSGKFTSLFIAFFKSQRAGVAPHSPKVCLPGSGWVPTTSETLPINIQGRGEPIYVNRYIVSKGQNRSLVIYWYQTPYRIIAGEFTAKFYTVVDGLRHHRSDTSLIRVIVPIGETESENQAETTAMRFIQDAFEPIRTFLPI
jgi:EpsI family protein